MTRRTPLLLVLSSLTGCAGTLYSATKATSTTAPDAAYSCAQDQLKQLGYQRKSYDVTERWYVARKDDEKARVSDVRFRKRYNQIEVKVRPDASGNSSLELKAQTFDQYSDQQGITDSEQKASNQVKLDAQALTEACGK